MYNYTQYTCIWSYTVDSNVCIVMYNYTVLYITVSVNTHITKIIYMYNTYAGLHNLAIFSCREFPEIVLVPLHFLYCLEGVKTSAHQRQAYDQCEWVTHLLPWTSTYIRDIQVSFVFRLGFWWRRVFSVFLHPWCPR